jgi:hypothetical protein
MNLGAVMAITSGILLNGLFFKRTEQKDLICVTQRNHRGKFKIKIGVGMLQGIMDGRYI